MRAGGAGLRSRPRRVAEVLVFVLDRGVVVQGPRSRRARTRGQVRWRSCGHAGRGCCRSYARVLACARPRRSSSRWSSSLSTAAAASTNCAACRRRSTSLFGGPSAETCARRSAVAPSCTAAAPQLLGGRCARPRRGLSRPVLSIVPAGFASKVCNYERQTDASTALARGKNFSHTLGRSSGKTAPPVPRPSAVGSGGAIILIW